MVLTLSDFISLDRRFEDADSTDQWEDDFSDRKKPRDWSWLREKSRVVALLAQAGSAQAYCADLTSLLPDMIKPLYRRRRDIGFGHVLRPTSDWRTFKVMDVRARDILQLGSVTSLSGSDQGRTNGR